jgi:hypothetical protein
MFILFILHFVGLNSHFLAQTTNQQKTSMEVVKTNAINKSRDAVISAMTNVYIAAKNDLANAVVSKLHKRNKNILNVLFLSINL